MKSSLSWASEGWARREAQVLASLNLIKENGASNPTRVGMVVVLNWFEELKAKLAKK